MLKLYFTKTLFLTSVFSCVCSAQKHVTQSNLRRADVTERIRHLNGLCE